MPSAARHLAPARSASMGARSLAPLGINFDRLGVHRDYGAREGVANARLHQLRDFVRLLERDVAVDAQLELDEARAGGTARAQLAIAADAVIRALDRRDDRGDLRLRQRRIHQ